MPEQIIRDRVVEALKTAASLYRSNIRLSG